MRAQFFRNARRWASLSAALAFSILAAIGGSASAQSQSDEKPWVVYYDDDVTLEALLPYDLIILDSKYHPPLPPLSDRGKTLYGYLSVGEVENHRAHYEKVRAEGILLEENKFWKGSYFVDVRDTRWIRRVIEELIPAILRQGFDGVFLDTLDNPIYLEERDPIKFAGMREAAVRLVKTIRRHYPNTKIIVNRAYGILTDVALDIDAVLGESVFADYDFETKTYDFVEEDLYRHQVEILSDLKARFPSLRILTLDYWNPDDPEGLRRIYDEQRANGFMPYVSTIALDRIISEPPK